MTDFRDLHNRPHDLRSQLGLKNSGMSDERRISLGLRPFNNESSILGDALRIEPKPLDPDDATPNLLYSSVSTKAQANRVSKWFEAQQGQGVTVLVNSNDKVPEDLQAYVDDIQSMMRKPSAAFASTLGRLGPSIYLDGTPISEFKEPQMIHAPGDSQVLFDARAIARLIPAGTIRIHGMEPADYVDKFGPMPRVIEVRQEDITAVGTLTEDQASVLRATGLDCVSVKVGPVNRVEPGKAIPRATNARTLTDIHAHICNLEADILDALVMANQNPLTDARRSAAARDQLEMGFMMLKKAVDPKEQGE